VDAPCFGNFLARDGFVPEHASQPYQTACFLPGSKRERLAVHLVLEIVRSVARVDGRAGRKGAPLGLNKWKMER